MITRRSFAKLSAATIALVYLPFTGCFSQSQIAALASILGATAASIASLQGNSVLAAKLTTDTAAAVAAINAWKSGTSTQEIILALNLVEDDLNLFPIIGPYVPLIDLAIGTVESILALLPQNAISPATIAPHAARRHVTLPFAAPKTAKAYKTQWNLLVDADPRIPQPLKVK